MLAVDALFHAWYWSLVIAQSSKNGISTCGEFHYCKKVCSSSYTQVLRRAFRCRESRFVEVEVCLVVDDITGMT